MSEPESQINSPATDKDKTLYFLIDERETEYSGPGLVPHGYSVVVFECETPEDSTALSEALKKVKRASIKKGQKGRYE